ncbi:MAG: divalent metal cation transporter, partial [Actinomycetota bacterium]
TASYLSVERIAVAFGLFELAFVYIAVNASPDAGALAAGLRDIPLTEPRYLYLVTANIGAVIMPWMVFFQQSAVVEKGLGPDYLHMARIETALGAVLTQAVMASVLVAAASTIGAGGEGATLDTVQQISDTLVPVLGWTMGRAVFVLGMSGAALVATIVVSLTAAWTVAEVAGYRRSLADHPREAPGFYGIFTACLVVAGALVASGANLVELSIAVEVVNALLLPCVLGFLFALSRSALPESHRLKGAYAWVAGAVLLATALFGVAAGLIGVFG